MPNPAIKAALAACSLLLAACDATLDDPNATFNIEASVTGLQGTLRLFNAGAGILEITGNGDVTIATRIATGRSYNLVIARQPYGQSCTLANGSGVAGNDMATVQIACPPPQYPVGVTVSGSTGTLVLSNGTETLTATGNGTFAFATPAGYGDAYAVAVDSEPVGHACSVTDGGGAATGQVIDVAVDCVAVDPFMIRKLTVSSPGPKFLRIGWQAVPGVTHYRLMRDNDGIPGGTRTQVGFNTTALAANDRVAVHLRTSYLYSVDACDAIRCVESVTRNVTGADLRRAIGYFKRDRVSPYGHYFGASTSLSSDGKTLGVGSSGMGGYVFTQSTSTWTRQARIANLDYGDGEPLGHGMVLSKDGLTLFARQHQGPVQVYTRNLGTWSLQADIHTPAIAELGGRYAFAVAASGTGNTLAISYYTGNYYHAQYVCIFERSGTVWSHTRTIGPANWIGSSVSLSTDGNTLAIGAFADPRSGTGINPTVTLTQNTQSIGAAYVYVRSGTDWALQATFKPDMNYTPGYYGNVVLSGNGNVLAVGASGDRNANGGINPAYSTTQLGYSGAVYVYARSGTSWTRQAYIKPYVPGLNDSFGQSIALSGDGRTLAVGAPYEESAGIDLEPGMTMDNSAPYAGAAYVFTRPYSNWKQVRYIKAPLTHAEDRFGSSIALSADASTLAVGAIYESGSATGINGDPAAVVEPYRYSGAVYLY